jgi:hypothetical protein
MRLPIGGAAILEARQNGKAPADAVVVSLCGRRDDFANPQVIVMASNHEWGFLAGLDVIVCVEPKAKFVRATMAALARVTVEPLSVWDVQARRGMTVWPVWRAADGGEAHRAPPAQLRSATFIRWARMTWLPAENRRFFECN